MGVDNSGIILVGQRECEDFDPRLAFYSKEQIQNDLNDDDGDIDDYVYYTKGEYQPKLLLDWSLGVPCGYDSSKLVGFYIKSPSYGAKALDLPSFLADIVTLSQEWKKYVGQMPEVFVLNLQS